MKNKLLTFILILLASCVMAQNPDTVIYKAVNDKELKMYIFKPEKQAESKAAMVLFHGGGWNAGKPQALFKQAQYFASRGFTVFLPQYRLRKTDSTTIVEAVTDAKDAMGWVRKHAGQFNIDPDKIIAGGGSAGGHLAIITAMNTDIESSYSPREYQPDALVLFNPVLDVSKEGYGHYKVSKEAASHHIPWSSLSPINNIRRGLPPCIVLVGDKDKVLPKPTALKFEKMMKKAGNDCEVRIYPGGEHTFFNYGYAGKMGYPKGTKNRYYYEVLQDADDFLVNHGYLERHIKAEIPEDAVYPIRKE
jgi:acetyl esterase/lipase